MIGQRLASFFIYRKEVIEIQNGQIILMRLTAIITMLSFAGEFYRKVHNIVEITMMQFFANLIAGGALSALIAYIIYEISENETITYTTAGLLSYQRVEKIQKVAQNMINHFIKEVKE